MEVAASCGVTVEPNTALLHYDIGQGFVTVPMQLVSENVYDAGLGQLGHPSSHIGEGTADLTEHRVGCV